MNYNNRSYPHPVLGMGNDYFKGKLTVELKVSSNRENISIEPIFVLDNSELNEAILNGKAYYVSHIYCRGTLFRDTFRSNNSLTEPILIPANKLNGEVEIDFFICAFSNVDGYYSNSFNPDYGKTKFSLDKADIMAYAGKGKFHANKTPEELKAISALMNIDCSGKKSGPMYLEYTGQKITIMLSQEDYQNYFNLKSNKKYFGVLLSSLVLPALIEALYYLDTDEAQEFQSHAWFQGLTKIKEDLSKFGNVFKIAQRILDNPLNKCFVQLVNNEEYE